MASENTDIANIREQIHDRIIILRKYKGIKTQLRGTKNQNVATRLCLQVQGV